MDLLNNLKDRSNIRNICILAHVDHGKTSLADMLVASNGIISHRQAGKLRYLDSREDEQLRGITMKSSAIALQYTSGGKSYLINLLDSPGHVDFSSEVSTAIRLCDGALVVIDVVEGVCPQTQTVLHQAWLEGIKPCLVLNKMDKLITELKYSPIEAYSHLVQVLEQVNAFTGQLFTSQVLEEAEQRETVASTEVEADQVYDWSTGLDDIDDSNLYFSPEQGNVIFTSAIDGWGFGINHFAQMYARKVGIKASVLEKTLWGDYFLNTKSKRIFKGAQAKGKKPLFVQFVLENLWAVYDAVLANRDKEKIDKIVHSLGLKVSARDLSHNDKRVSLTAICSQWLPIAPTVLDMVVTKLPSPLQITSERVERLMCNSEKSFASFPAETQQLKEAFLECSTDRSAPVIVFISKMFPFCHLTLPQHKSRPLTMEEIEKRRERVREKLLLKLEQKEKQELEQPGEQEDKAEEDNAVDENNTEETNFLAFGRIYSGTIHKGQKVFVLQPRYDPRVVSVADNSPQSLPEHVSSCTITDLFIFMGKEISSTDAVSAGCVVGIAGLEEHVIKCATLSSTLACPSFRSMSFVAAPIVRVALEPVHACDMSALVKGLHLLNQADPSVEVTVQETGEHILAGAGEVHLLRCLDDLKKDYAKVELNVSEPIVPFRETVITPPKIDMVNEIISSENERILQSTQPSTTDNQKSRNVEILTADKTHILCIEAKPLPEEVTKLLDTNSALLKSLHLFETTRKSSGANQTAVELNEQTISALLTLKKELQTLFDKAGEEWNNATNKMWSLGPKFIGPNILLNDINDYNRPSIWSILEDDHNKNATRDYDYSIISGFQMGTGSGPLCEEPLHGVGFVLKKWENCSKPTNLTINTAEDPVPTGGDKVASYGPLSGQLISAMNEGCRKALLVQPARLMAAMYTCNIRATAEVLGKLYAVLGKRNGQVLSEEMIEGSSMFIIEAVIPVAESFGFAEDMRRRTSGLASPQLVFSHWEVIPFDPFWVPSTEEELLHFGEKADSDNLARRYMDQVRRRKGLQVEEKLVEHAEKQRTLSKNK